MNFTVATHNSLTKTDGYIHYNDVDFHDIPEMVRSGFNYVACKLRNGIRLDDNFDGFVDVLIIDVDEACTITQAKSLFSKFEFYLVTSKSHQKDKNGMVCDRFRMFFRLENTIYIRQQMEEIYNLFIKKYPFIDTKCKNVSRLYYSSPENAEVIYNEGARYTTKIILSGVEAIKTEKEYHHKASDKIKHIDEIFVLNELTGLWTNKYGETLGGQTANDTDSKLRGVQSYLEQNYYDGNKANCLFCASAMMKKDAVFTDDFIVDYLINYFQSNTSSNASFKTALQNIKGGLRV